MRRVKGSHNAKTRIKPKKKSSLEQISNYVVDGDAPLMAHEGDTKLERLRFVVSRFFFPLRRFSSEIRRRLFKFDADRSLM